MRVLTVFTLLLVSVTQGQSPIDPSVPGACDVCIECAQCAECSQCDACSDCAPCSVCAGREEEDECEVCKPCSACNFCSECAQCDACSQCAPCLELSSASSDSDDAGDTDDAAETEAAKMGSGAVSCSSRSRVEGEPTALGGGGPIAACTTTGTTDPTLASKPNERRLPQLFVMVGAFTCVAAMVATFNHRRPSSDASKAGYSPVGQPQQPAYGAVPTPSATNL